MPGKFTLGKKERLKRRKIIDHLFSDGKSFSVFPIRVAWSKKVKLDSPLQAGFGVSSRQFKKAVERNRIKRLLREAYRLQKNELQLVLEQKDFQLALFLVYIGKELPDYALVSEKINVILKRLIANIHEAPPANT